MSYLNLSIGLVCCPEAEEDDELLPSWRDVSLRDDRLHQAVGSLDIFSYK